VKMLTKYIAGVILIIVCAFEISCSKQEDSGSKPVAKAITQQDITDNNRAVGLMGKYEYSEAYSIFAALIANHPAWLDVKVNLAIATLNRQQEGDEATALKLLHEVIAADPKNLRALFTAALLMRRTGEPQNLAKAFDYYKTVAEADPNDAYAAYQVGSGYRDAGDYEQALSWFEKATKLDPYLKSAYYGSQQMYIRLGNTEKAQEMVAIFQRLGDNPRAKTIKEIYGRMGSKANALAIGLEKVEPKPRPTGQLFADPVALLDDGESYTWNTSPRDRPMSITACDINGDGLVDIFIAGALRHQDAVNAVIINQGNRRFTLNTKHALALVHNVRAALWGDYDNDGLTDVYLCCNGPNQLWRQVEPDVWEDVTESTKTQNGEYDTVDGAFFDADHDGDLDIFCVNADGPNELLNNNLDGTFRAIAQERGIAGNGRASRQVVIADLDSDRDADIIVINDQAPHEVYLNDRLWEYHEAEEFSVFCNTPMSAVVSSDLDADGAIELYSLEPVRDAFRWCIRWTRNPSNNWTATDLMEPPDWGGLGEKITAPYALALEDLDGDGVPEALVFDSGNMTVWDVGGTGGVVWGLVQQDDAEIVGWATTVLDPSTGPVVIGIPRGRVPFIVYPGPGRHKFAALKFTGKDDKANETRSNVSGIGVHAEIRIDSMWTVRDTFRNSSGPGQSLQPIAVGLGGYDKIDFVAMDWSDGVLQTEIDLTAGKLHIIEEIQRQKSSCPVLYAWDGEKFEFVSDLLGVGGLGFLVAPGEYAPPRPWENFMLPMDALKPHQGRYKLKIGEPMEEACYLDSAKLIAYDLPPGWKMTLDERMSILGPAPTGKAVFYKKEIQPMRVVNDRGDDVTSLVLQADLQAAPVGKVDHRFIGRLIDEHIITLEFAEPLDNQVGQPILIADGWVEYPYSQTMFAAWQANAEYLAPTIEALDADGNWQIVLEQFGYPAGMPRQMSVPLNNLPSDTTKLRIRTTQEIYWDRLSIAYAQPCPQAKRTELPLAEARLGTVGFPNRTTAQQRLPHYDYNNRSPLWDTRHMQGNYTAFGNVNELVRHGDDALAIFGPGEEIHFEFDANLKAPPTNWTRRLVIETQGWCKDMDLYTKDGETVGPLPQITNNENPKRETLHKQFNTRFEEGR